MPMNSSKGLFTTVQYNYQFNSTFQFYLSGGYVSWDQYKISLRTDFPYPQQQVYSSYTADDHVMIPINIGTRINLHTNSWFTSFLNFEAGYYHLSYNKFTNYIARDPQGLIIGFYANMPGTKVVENLLGFGIGAGISHPINKNLAMVFAYKLNSFANMNGHAILTTRTTYSTVTAGFDYNI